MSTSTVRLHRVLRANPEKVYRAFLAPDAMVKWLPPHGFTGKVHHLDAKVGGTYRMSFTNFATGNSQSKCEREDPLLDLMDPITQSAICEHSWEYKFRPVRLILLEWF